jgi:hypothetical protein
MPEIIVPHPAFNQWLLFTDGGHLPREGAFCGNGSLNHGSSIIFWPQQPVIYYNSELLPCPS